VRDNRGACDLRILQTADAAFSQKDTAIDFVVALGEFDA
jgi:hypothetical protein